MKSAALIAIACSGCSLGFGSAFVGQWRPHTDHAYVACLEDETGKCVDEKAVDVPVPPRKFWGYMVLYPAIGAAIVHKNGRTDTRFRAEAANEYVRGWGRFAWGVRASALFDVNQHTSLNLMGTGYVSLTQRLALRIGLGYSPWTRSHGEMAETTFLAGRALAGVQFALSRTRSENFLVVSIDVDRMRVQFDDPVDVTGIVGNLGVFF
jgi:hypothetical protein